MNDELNSSYYHDVITNKRCSFVVENPAYFSTPILSSCFIPFHFLTLVLSTYASCRIPVIGGKDLDLHHLFVEVTSRGGIGRVMLKFCPVLWKK